MTRIDANLYGMIRRMYVAEGYSQRHISRVLNVSRKTVRKYCEGACLPKGKKTEPSVYKSEERLAIEKVIEDIYEANKDAPKKQQLNSRIVWEMLLESGYRIGHSTIRRYIRELRGEKPEIFIPLEFEPGEMIQIDWGDAYAYISDVKTKVSVFCSVLPYSFGIYCAVFPDKKNASFFTGHVMAFEHFNGVPRYALYDNLRSSVLEGSGENAIKQENFKKLEAHYAFESKFCNIESGNEKGGVENLVSIVRSIAFVPMPRVDDYQQLQEHVTRKCVQYSENHRIKTRSRNIKDMLEEERPYLMPLPVYPWDPCEEFKVKVHSDLTVRVENLRYSVPGEYAGMTLTAKVSPFNVDLYKSGELVWKHKKGMHATDHQYIPEHYLDILLSKPRAIPNAVPIKRGVMPAEMSDFLKLCKEPDKNFHFVDILLLGRKTDADKLLWAVRQANLTGSPSYDKVCLYLGMRANGSSDDLNMVDIKTDPVDFELFDRLMEGSEYSNDNDK